MKIIYLYIKESPLGLKYLGVTTKNPYNYKGSGQYWKKHLKKHNFSCLDIATTILLETTEKDVIQFFGLYYSKIFNVVENLEWANLIPESGEFSTLGYKHKQETKNIISIKNKGKKRTKEQSENLSFLRKGRKLSIDTKIKIGQANKHKKASLETKIKIGESGKKPIIQLDLTDNFIKEWDCALSASKFLNIANTNITQCCKQKAKTSGGFKWKYKLDK